MPCVCGDRCTLPDSPEEAICAHKCPGCHRPIHAICGVQNEESHTPIASTNWCFTCWEKRNLNLNSKPAAKKRKNQPAKKETGRKVKAGRNKIEAPKQPVKKEDPFLNKKVAFPIEGDKKPAWIDLSTLDPCLCPLIGERRYLFGTTVKREKKSDSYVVEWEHSSLGKTTGVFTSILFSAINLAELLSSRKTRAQQPFPLTNRVLHVLTAVTDEDERGTPLQSDDEEEDTDPNMIGLEQDDGFIKPASPTVGVIGEDDLVLPSLTNEGPATRIDGLEWSFNKSSTPPINVSRGKQTELKQGSSIRFVNPLSSFLVFIPIELWKLYLFRTNTNGAYKCNQAVQKAQQEGRQYLGRLWQNATLNEVSMQKNE